VSIGSFLLRRLGSGLLAIFGVCVLTFAFLHIVPGDPIDHLAGGDVTAAQRANLEHCLGLDKSLPTQFATFLGHIADGTLGHQCPDPTRRPSVAARIKEVLPYTIELAIAAMLIAIVLAIPLGVIAAMKRGTWIDTATTAVLLTGIVIPIMLLAQVMLVWFFVDLGWLPGPTETGLASLFLPALALGTHLMAMLSRMTRSSMVDVLGEDFVRTARAKGVSERRVVFVHALRNALLPVITIAGLQFGSLLSGSIIVEKVFARPGLGTTLLDAIFERDYPMVQGITFVIALIYIAVNTVVDIAYGLADPRIRHA
jgi:ABC-type dipeptide/oligopeptide/nickel transport system permease component